MHTDRPASRQAWSHRPVSVCPAEVGGVRIERLTLNQRVQGSSPCAPTIENNALAKILIRLM
jgi:hypothetical protein